MSLAEGQYQIGNVVFGKNTNIVIVGVDQIGYEMQAGDRPMPMSDELRFTKDYVQPGVMQFSLGVLDNYILEGLAGSVSDLSIPVVRGHDILDDLKKEWRADEVRKQWGVTKPLRYKTAGRARMMYGRPRAIATDRIKSNAGWYNVTATYQLADTYSYAEEFSYAIALPTAVGTSGGNAIRPPDKGTAPSWVKALITGPITGPIVAEIGSLKFTIDKTLTAGQAIELNSYPWERRAVDSLGNNIGTKLIADSPYLEDVRLPPSSIVPIALHGSGTNANTALLVQWQEAYHAT